MMSTRLARLAAAAALAAASCAPRPVFAQADSVTLRASYTVELDMLEPRRISGLRATHTVTVRLSGLNRIDESWDSRAGRKRGSSASVRVLGGASSERGNSWRVAPGNRLVRTINWPRNVITITLTVDHADRCSIEVTQRLKPGFSTFRYKRISTGEWATYAQSRVVASECRVEK
jgi:hypothetical protein